MSAFIFAIARTCSVWIEESLALHRACQQLLLLSCATYRPSVRAQRKWIIGKIMREHECSHQNVGKVVRNEWLGKHFWLSCLKFVSKDALAEPQETPKAKAWLKSWNIGAIIFKMRAICSRFPYMKQHDYNSSHTLLLHHMVIGSCCWHTEEGGCVYCVGCDPLLLWWVRQLELFVYVCVRERTE